MTIRNEQFAQKCNTLLSAFSKKKKKSSVANSLAKNNKRKLSAVEQLSNVKMGHTKWIQYMSQAMLNLVVWRLVVFPTKLKHGMTAE